METTISDQIPAYAAAHLGWAGRANGPIDNPISGCLSCHSTAEFPVSAGLNFTAQCDTDAKKMFWFRNFRGNQAFGAVTAATCRGAAVRRSGFCRRNEEKIVVVPGAVVVEPRAVVVEPERLCPLGMHWGPHRRECVLN